MTPTLTPITTSKDSLNKQLRCYINQHPYLVVAEIIDSKGNKYERIIFPQERLLIEDPEHKSLTIKYLDDNSKIVRKNITYAL